MEIYTATVRKEWGVPQLMIIDIADINAKTQVGHLEGDFANIVKTGGGSYKFYTAGNPVAVGTQNYNFVAS
ncbi:hypothetical protein ACFGVR_11280 [Mucilaginibacter sp. AW1-3]